MIWHNLGTITLVSGMIGIKWELISRDKIMTVLTEGEKV